MSWKELLSAGDPSALFQLTEQIAEGCYGIVYKAIHKPSGDTVALKIIKPEEDETWEDMMTEVKILKYSNHPNLIKLYGAWRKKDELFIAMELADAGSVSDLYEVLNRPLEEPVIALICRECLKGLEYLHKTGIIHRDIKAANVLLTSAGDVKLTDFGVSAIRINNEKRRTVIGTPYWIAPEVGNGSWEPYDEKCDIWSLGITCIEMAELAPPNYNTPAMQVLIEVMKNPPPRLKDGPWSDDFRDFVARCLTKDPSKRASASELLQHPFIRNMPCQKQYLSSLIDTANMLENDFANQTDDEDVVLGPAEDRSEFLSSSSSSPMQLPSTSSIPALPSASSMSALPAETHHAASSAVGPSMSTPPTSNPMLAPFTANPMPVPFNTGPPQPDLPVVRTASATTSSPRNAAIGPSVSAPPSNTSSTPAPPPSNNTSTSTPSIAPPRPRTSRTLKKSHTELEVMARKLLKEQLKELKALQNEHVKEQEFEQLQQQSRELQKAKIRAHQAMEAKLLKDEMTDFEVIQKGHEAELKSFQRNQAEAAKRKMKEIHENTKTLMKEFKEQQKAKEVKTSDKAAKQVAREVKEMEELEMQQELQRVETTQIHAVEEKNLEALHKFQREQKIRELKLLREHLRKRNEAQMQNLLEVQSLQRDIPIFEQQARKKHQMEKQQLQQTQRLEELKLLMAQQEKQLNMSQMIKTREFKEKQRQRQREWLQSQKGKDKKLLRQLQEERKAELEREDREFQEMIAKEKEALIDKLRAMQRDQLNNIKEVLTVRTQVSEKVEDETREREQQMFEEHLQQQKKLLSELKQREVDLLRSQYNVRRQQCIEQMQAHQNLLRNQLAELRQTIDQQRAQMEDLCREHTTVKTTVRYDEILIGLNESLEARLANVEQNYAALLSQMEKEFEEEQRNLEQFYMAGVEQLEVPDQPPPTEPPPPPPGGDADPSSPTPASLPSSPTPDTPQPLSSSTRLPAGSFIASPRPSDCQFSSYASGPRPALVSAYLQSSPLSPKARVPRLPTSPRLKSGWMHRSNGKNWKKCWVTLVVDPRKELRYFSDEGSKKPKGVIDLTNATSIRPTVDPKARVYAFDIAIAGKIWTLGCDTREEMEDWIEVLRQWLFP